ncbi:sensor histidine kinase KdpD [Nocardiopsis sp. MG754419]|uniref:sensor histidine kinase n=1 Tax=Nocardiopsis sp. MG754419 TaxID=2259865 RepID=UPI001BAB9D7E|nr:ATP-binding protein [Nocardiopsis sp. MG754419]MBR8744053.1 ATP-binding protein [Nocardiopsis sp. MG754419]
MLLTDAAVPAEPATAHLWLWALAVSTVVLLALTVSMALRSRRARRRAAETALRDAGLIEEARAAAARAEARADRLQSALSERDRAARTVTEDVFPLVMRRIREGASSETVLAELDASGGPDPATRPLVEAVTRSLWRGHQQRRRLLSVVKGCAARARAGVAQLRADVQERSRPYWKTLDSSGAGDRVREDFMVMEAGLSRLEMLIQRLLTVAEADRIGRNWTQPLRIERLVRAAVGSVPEFARVQMHMPATPVVVEGRAVNSIIQVLAELVDNATSFSAPSEAVVVHFENTAMRLGVHIDDSGLAMTEEQLADVRRRLDTSRPPDIAELSANQLGLLVVRRAADPLDIRVDVAPSPRGGTRATVWIPRKGLLRTDDAAVAGAGGAPALAAAAPPADEGGSTGSFGSPTLRSVPIPEQSAAPTPPSPPVAPAAPAEPTATAETTGDSAPPTERPRHLPKRRRGATLPDEAATPKTVEPPRDRVATSLRIAQWHAHTRPTSNPAAENREDS